MMLNPRRYLCLGSLCYLLFMPVTVVYLHCVSLDDISSVMVAV